MDSKPRVISVVELGQIDPVAEPAAYQRQLLGLLGDDDPAEVQSKTPATLARLAVEAGRDIRSRPAAGEWSVLGCIAHMLDAEIVMSARYRWILAQDRPRLIGYDQDLWAERLHRDDESSTMLDLLAALRSGNLRLWRSTGAADRRRVGVHEERGDESLDLSFRMLAGHDRLHTAQAEEALRIVRGG
jgi:DinB family protein